MFPYLKYVSLAILVVQTTASVLILRYSRTNAQSGPRYLSSTAIAVSEIFKILACFFFLCIECGFSITSLLRHLQQEVWEKPKDTIKLIIPAAIYTFQNNLLFLALSYLDAATFQVTYQLKILTTAMFSVMMLHRRLEPSQWLALVLLMLGVALVQWPNAEQKVAHKQIDHSTTTQIFGLIIVLFASFSSGFSGVYFEKLVKSSSQSLWIRNTQLAIFSIMFSLVVIVFQDYEKVANHGFFQGYQLTTWLVILLQAFGGLIVSCVMKYADNILKGFATTISIVLSTLCSYYLLIDFTPNKYFFSGATIVISATVLYGCQVKFPETWFKESPRKNEDKNSSQRLLQTARK